MLSSDHSTFSRFRSRFSEKAMIIIKGLIEQFDRKGLRINKVTSVAARLAKSAIRPYSDDHFNNTEDNHNSPEDKPDKDGKHHKFLRYFNYTGLFKMKRYITALKTEEAAVRFSIYAVFCEEPLKSNRPAQQSAPSVYC